MLTPSYKGRQATRSLALWPSIFAWAVDQALSYAIRPPPDPQFAALQRADRGAARWAAEPRTASARPMIDRDVTHLRELGIVIEISRTRPPLYTLHGGAPIFDDELRALGEIAHFVPFTVR